MFAFFPPFKKNIDICMGILLAKEHDKHYLNTSKQWVRLKMTWDLTHGPEML